MIFKEMEYVYTVYQERSFTRAAKKMCLSQPALSSMVKKSYGVEPVKNVMAIVNVMMERIAGLVWVSM